MGICSGSYVEVQPQPSRHNITGYGSTSSHTESCQMGPTPPSATGSEEQGLLSTFLLDMEPATKVISTSVQPRSQECSKNG